MLICCQTDVHSLHPGSFLLHHRSSVSSRAPMFVLFIDIQVSPPLNVNAILYLRTHPVILIFFPFPSPFFVCFQLSNGFSHYSLSSESHVGPTGAGLFPHCLPASRLLPRVTSVHLPDYAHYYTIGPGMFPSSQIPSWKVCVSPPPPLPVIASVLTPLLFQPPHPDYPLTPFLSHSAFFPIMPLPQETPIGGEAESSRQL